MLTLGNGDPGDLTLGRYYLKMSNRRIDQQLAALWENDDAATTAAAKVALARS